MEEEYVEQAVLALTDFTKPTKGNKVAMLKVRKKPVEVQALRWIALFDHAISKGGTIDYSDLVDGYSQDRRTGYIYTLEGRMEVSDGDWIIIGIKGERYPCKHEIFKGTYDFV